jgi:hypothetical protein
MEIGKVHEMFCERIIRIPSTTASGMFVRVLGRTYIHTYLLHSLDP